MPVGRPRHVVADLPQPGRALVMGVVNVTPDSFSDGGSWYEPVAAIAHGRELLAQGADLLDVGGESTRPGAQRPSVDEELRRVLPVVRALAADGALVSIDTMRAQVAEQAIQAGARAVNDVSGGLADPDVLAVTAAAGVPYVLMHWRGHSVGMQDHAVYDDVVHDVLAELGPRIDAALGAGIAPEHIAIDAGLGFAKTAEHNWTVLHRLEELHSLGFPVLVGASRKAFLGRLLADPVSHTLRPPRERDAASAAVSVLSALQGAWCIRVHDVPSTADAVRVVARWGQG